MQCLEYEPVVGMTVKQAIEKAIKTAKTARKTVITTINDIIVCIKPNTILSDAYDEYIQKLKLKSEIENVQTTKTR